MEGWLSQQLRMLSEMFNEVYRVVFVDEIFKDNVEEVCWY